MVAPRTAVGPMEGPAAPAVAVGARVSDPSEAKAAGPEPWALNSDACAGAAPRAKDGYRERLQARGQDAVSRSLMPKGPLGALPGPPPPAAPAGPSAMLGPYFAPPVSPPGGGAAGCLAAPAATFNQSPAAQPVPQPVADPTYWGVPNDGRCWWATPGMDAPYLTAPPQVGTQPAPQAPPMMYCGQQQQHPLVDCMQAVAIGTEPQIFVNQQVMSMPPMHDVGLQSVPSTPSPAGSDQAHLMSLLMPDAQALSPEQLAAQLRDAAAVGQYDD